MMPVLLASLAHAFDCGTVPVHPPPLPPLAAPPDGLALEEAFGDFEGRTRLTEHFAIKWGPDVTPDAEDLDTLADVLEEAHAAAADLGFPQGIGQDRWYTNFYVADTGGAVPPNDGVGGYATVDRLGNGYVVMSFAVVDNLTHGTPDRTAADWQSGVAHEVNHLNHLGSYAWFDHLWFWEMSANWFSNRLRPGNQDVVGYGAIPTLLPERAISTYDDENALTASYPYGAWPWLRGLEADLGPAFLIDLWSTRDTRGDPLDAMPGALRDHGGDLEAGFVDYAVARHTLELDQAAGIAAGVEEYAAYYPDLDHRIARRLTGPTDGWLAPRAKHQPEALASNVWRAEDLGEGTLVLDFEADATGTDGTRARFSVVAVADKERHDLPIDRTAGTWRQPLRGGETVELVVVSHPKTVVRDERFPYALSLAVEPAPADTGVPPSGPTEGCACSGAGSATPGWGLLALLGRR